MTENNSSKIWNRIGNAYHPSTKATEAEIIESGIHKVAYTPTGAWYLDHIKNRFEFPSKIYNAHGSILDRIYKRWVNHNQGNLGILLNGTKGSGKTLAMQLLMNKLMNDFNLPVIIIDAPSPLGDILDYVNQDCIVVFDEFEKTHKKPEDQEQLLTVLDGMNRSIAKRLFIFTTNSVSVNESLIDRPSRIHYKFEFTKIAESIIEGLMSDLLPEDCEQFKNDIRSYLLARKVLTIDTVIATVKEVAIFKESPLEFEQFLNISRSKPLAYIVNLLDIENDKKIELASSFNPNNLPEYQRSSFDLMLTGNKNAIDRFEQEKNPIVARSITFGGKLTLKIISKYEKENCWICEIGLPRDKTVFAPFSDLYENGSRLWLDERPDGWKLPIKKTKNLSEEEIDAISDLWDDCQNNRTVYGTGNPGKYIVEIIPKEEDVSKVSHTFKL